MESLHTAELVGAIIGLLLIAAGILAFSKHFKLPFTVLLVLVGIGLAQLAEHGPHMFDIFGEYEISPEIIMFVFLPTLIFESAFHLDARQLRRNLLPVMTLAVPGLLLSTAIIGFIIHLLTPVDLAAALLLGSILSATDPVAVISLFKQLGAPKRLTVLVEGESLFNDATSIVVSRILMTVVAAGYFTSETVFSGVISFFVVFFGGILVGWVTALLAGLALGQVENDPFIEISLTTVLAYFSFLIAEELFHVSGVMATVVAGITMGNWGRAKISPAVAGYLENFWEYMAYMANALIFLLVGMRVDLAEMSHSLSLLVCVLFAMLISRAVVIYTLVPIAGRLPGSEPVSRPYQTVMYWGGLRGAIALAIVLSLEPFAYRETFVAVVMGAVLFTLMAQGLTIEHLVRWLGLDKPPLADRVARAEGLLSAKKCALERIPELQTGGLFSARIAENIQQTYRSEMKELKSGLKQLHIDEINSDQERLLLFARGFAEEKTFYYDLFSKGHLSEQAYRDLCHSLDLQMEKVRIGNPLPHYTLHPPKGHRDRDIMYGALDFFLKFTPIPQQVRAGHIARDYEEAWGRYQGSSRILASMTKIDQDSASEEINTVCEFYQHWITSARERLDSVAAQFPEFTNAMQERLAGRLMVHAQKELIESGTRSGTIPSGVAEALLKELSSEIQVLRGRDLAQLKVDPSELLRKVPFFIDTPEQEFGRIAEHLLPHMPPAGDFIIRQGESGDSLFLIARGVVRVSYSVDGHESDLATLISGDFFGEMALLHKEQRTATCRAVTPCALYELKREDFDETCKACPSIQAALEEAYQQRKSEQ